MASLGSLTILRVPGFAFLCGLREKVSLRRWKTQNRSPGWLAHAGRGGVLACFDKLVDFVLLADQTLLLATAGGLSIFRHGKSDRSTNWVENRNSRGIDVKSREMKETETNRGVKGV